MHVAVLVGGNASIVKLLIQHGAVVNAETRDGETALDIAKKFPEKKGCVACVAVLSKISLEPQHQHPFVRRTGGPFAHGQLAFQRKRSLLCQDLLQGNFTLYRGRNNGRRADFLVPLAAARLGYDELAIVMNKVVPSRPPSDLEEGHSNGLWFKSRDKAELALELHSLLNEIRDEVNNEPNYLWGGLHYLMGAPDVFLSMLVCFLQQGTVLPLPAPSEVCDYFIPKEEWHRLKLEWDAIFQKARVNPQDVLCMWHFKETGCQHADCTFLHPTMAVRPKPS